MSSKYHKTFIDYAIIDIIKNIWKPYIWTADKDDWMKVILAVMCTT